MPNIASAKKNMRKSRAATVRNRAQRSALRTALKKAKAPGASADIKLAAAKLLDRAAGQLFASQMECFQTLHPFTRMHHLFERRRCAVERIDRS